MATAGAASVGRAATFDGHADAGQLVDDEWMIEPHLCGELAIEFLDAAFDLLRRPRRYGDGYAFRHLQLSVDAVAFDGRKETEHDAPARDERDR